MEKKRFRRSSPEHVLKLIMHRKNRNRCHRVPPQVCIDYSILVIRPSPVPNILSQNQRVLRSGMKLGASKKLRYSMHLVENLLVPEHLLHTTPAKNSVSSVSREG
jgi:hypothetical protein